jgi:hypothetical protein
MAEAFLQDIQTKPIYVAFFHGEFDTCPPMSEDIRTLFHDIPVNPAQQPSLTVPTGVSIIQLTQPGEYLSVSSSILYYLIHKKPFYTNTLMPLFAVDDPVSLLSHPNTKHVSWNMEDRKGQSFENIVTAGNKLKVEETAQAALQVMKSSMSSKPYEASDKTHFESVLRFTSGDTIPNLKLSRFDAKMTGIGLYKYSPTNGKVTKIPLEILHKRERFELEDSLRLYHLVEHIRKIGGGRLMLFSCSSLAPKVLSTKSNVAKAAIAVMRNLQESYKTRHPVCSPTRDWDLFVRTFPSIAMPNLTFENATTLKAHDNKITQWILYKALQSLYFYADMPEKNLAGSIRNNVLQTRARHGRYLQNLGNNLGEGAPRVGESGLSYGCRRSKEGCAIMGGKRKTRRRKRSGEPDKN